MKTNCKSRDVSTNPVRTTKNSGAFNYQSDMFNSGYFDVVNKNTLMKMFTFK